MLKRDFTLKRYRELLLDFLDHDYYILPVKNYFEKKPNKKRLLILRHDVDRKPLKSLHVASIEKELGIRSTFYFRTVSTSFDREIIRSIASMGHEIGYHYEDFALAKGNVTLAIKSFGSNLEKIRAITEIKTLCMHGSPLSKWNNLIIWKYINYKDYDLIAEPFLDLDFNRVLYLTDTGRRWDGDKFSIRDSVDVPNTFAMRHTHNISNNLKSNKLPDIIMLNSHPQRWDDKYLAWGRELFLQFLKNQVKIYLINYR